MCEPLKFTLLIIILANVCGCSLPQTKIDNRPNIILIFSDDQGMNDVGCYGSEISTPNIDSIASNGVKFNSWYVASSICTPSRFGLLTGKYPSRSEDRLLDPLMFLEEQDLDRGIKKTETTIATVLSESGYATALIGKWHLGHGSRQNLPPNHGFQEFFGHTGGCIDYFTMRYGIKQDWYEGFEHKDTVGYATDIITDRAVDYIDRQKDKPFFLYLSYNAPHFSKGWDVGRQQVINFMQAKDSDLKAVRHIKDPIRRQFAAMVKSMDDGIGRVLNALKSKGLTENTLVIFMPDNGGDYKYGGSNLPLRGQKATLFEGGIKVPCVMQFPARVKKSFESDVHLGAIDLFPTFCKMAGIEPGIYKPDGHDILPILEQSSFEREMFFELEDSTALRIGDWKFLKDKDSKGMLFNLKKDPNEKNDLSEKRSDIFRRLADRNEELMETLSKQK